MTIGERLRRQAVSASHASKILADAKTARQTDGGGPYEWALPEQTLEAKAADEIDRLTTLLDRAEAALEEAQVTLNAIASWRADSAAYTDRMNIPRRKMDEAQVIHIETEAKRALRPIAAALTAIRQSAKPEKAK